MRAIVPLHAGTGGATKGPALLRRPVEKTSASSVLDRKQQHDADERKKAPAPLRVELVSRDDTPRLDPFWDKPRLVPAFVAQMLGQRMPEQRERAIVETTYGRTGAPRTALLLDRKS